MGATQSRDTAASGSLVNTDRSHVIRQQESRRLAFLERRGGNATDSYILAVIARPSPPRPWPAAGPDSALWAPTSLQIAQRRLAFALGELEGSVLLAHLDADVLMALGRVLAGLKWPLSLLPLRFCAAGLGYHITGASARTDGEQNPQWSVALTGTVMVSQRRFSTGEVGLTASDPSVRQKMKHARSKGVSLPPPDAVLVGGRTCCRFSIEALSDPLMIGLALYENPSRERAHRGDSFPLALGSSTGKVCQGGSRISWPGMQGFGPGDTVDLLLDANSGRVEAKKNGDYLGTVAETGVTGQLCWAVSMGGLRHNAVRVESLDPDEF